VTARNLVLRALNISGHSPGSAERYLDRAFEQEPFQDGRDRAFTVHLVQGVLRWQLRLDWIIKQAVRFPFKKIELPLLNILRIALYQIFFMDRVPETAAVNEAVKQAKALGQNHLTGFVNGILRQICRQKANPAFPDPQHDRVHYLSVYYSYPTWLVKKWIRELGIDSTERLLEAGNRVPPLVVRVNGLKVDRQGLLGHLNAEGVKGRPVRYAPEGVEILGAIGPVTRLSSFKEGLFQVQGQSAQVCSHALSPGPGESVLDLCAGLGGKSTHMAQLMGGNGFIVALDMSHGRLVRLGESTRRLGIGCIRPVVADAGNTLSHMFRHSFDSILIDSPCSGLGTLSRHPDGKWIRDEGDIRRLARLQKDILKEAIPLLGKGGRMLYVTCTISKEENEDVVGNTLERNRGIVLENLKDHMPEWGLDLIDDDGFLRTLPHVHGIEGFFGALFVKIK